MAEAPCPPPARVHVFTLAFAPSPGMQPRAGPCRQPSSSWLRPNPKPLPRTFCTLCSPRASAPKQASPGKRGSWWCPGLRSLREEPLQTSWGGHARPFPLCSPGGHQQSAFRMEGEARMSGPAERPLSWGAGLGNQGQQGHFKEKPNAASATPPGPKGGKPSFGFYSCEC